jgi:glycosyltransferase involved in cell wall biosynthesis
MRIAYIENARVPTEKAHGYQIVKTCEALVNTGVEVQLFVAERRNPLSDNDPFESYGVSEAFDLFRLPVIDLMDVVPALNRYAYALERWSFLRSVRRARLSFLASDAWYTRDPAVADTLVTLRCARPIFIELHNADTRVSKLAPRVAGWVVISQGLKTYLIEQGVPEEKIIVARDGFDAETFTQLPSREEARRALNIDPNVFLAVYTGHLYPWKGVDSIAPAFSKLPEGVEIAIVGGYPQDIERVKGRAGYAPRVKFIGHQSRKDVVQWLAAANAALVPTSSRFDIGKSYTSPLKLFEALASGLPIIASDVPSAREILDESVATFFAPDDPDAFLQVLSVSRGKQHDASVSKNMVRGFSWKNRGKNIGEMLEVKVADQETYREKGVLVVTQAVDEENTNLSFFLDWLRELASRVRVVHVAAWSVGTYQLPSNVHVHEMSKGKMKRIVALKVLTWNVRKDVDTVFVHMLAPVAAVMGIFWRLMGKRLVLWYTHGSVPTSLRVANIFVNGICTATSPSMNLKTMKKVVTGHGIDTNRFCPRDVPRLPEMITVGRISPRKHIEYLFDLVAEIKQAHPTIPFRLRVVGDAYLASDRSYAESLASEVERRGLKDIISLNGARLGEELINLYRRSAIFVTASETGSLDKVVLESLSCGTPVLALSNVFAGFKGVRIATDDWDDESIAFVVSRLAHPASDGEARNDVIAKASLKTLISRLVSILLD